MKKKPRKPRPLKYLGNILRVTDTSIIRSSDALTPYYLDLPIKDAKRLLKWLKQATEYLEMKEKKK